MSAEHVRVQSDARNPFRDKPRILPRRHGLARPSPACEQKLAGHLASRFEVVINGLTGLLRQFKPDRTPGLSLAHGRPCERVAVRGNIVQTRMCRFPASGSSWESLAHSCVSMDDPDCRQRMALKERIEPVPLEPALAIPHRQPFAPGPCDLIGVPA